MIRWSLGLALLLLPATASAQVNTEKLRSWEREGFGGAFDFSMHLQKGNVDVLRLGSALRVQYVTLHPEETTTSTKAPPRREVKDLVLLIGNINFGRQVDERFLNNGFSHLRWTRMWVPRAGSEVFTQAQYNEFQRLKRRLLFGIGARVRPVDEVWGEVAIGSAPMLEIERIADDLGVDPDTQVVRWSNYVSFKFFLEEPRVQIVNTLYIQPRFDEFSDYRFLSEGEIGVKVIRALELVVTVSVLYDSRPPPTVKKLDTIITNALRVTF